MEHVDGNRALVILCRGEYLRLFGRDCGALVDELGGGFAGSSRDVGRRVADDREQSALAGEAAHVEIGELLVGERSDLGLDLGLGIIDGRYGLERGGIDVNNLFVLDPDLKEAGSVTGFARNESIKAVRYVGDKAYVITYEAIDPLFIIDLSDPEDPSIEGEVMIDGFSTLLVPVNEGRMLGIGHATGDNGYGGEYDSGLKLALFDISDPSHPAVLDSMEFKDMMSPAQSDHHALMVNAEAGYTHSVDYDIAYNGADNELSRVNTFKPKAVAKLNYRKDVFSAGLTAKFSGNFSHEEEYGLRDMNVCDYQFGFNAQYTIPLVKLTVGTDINLYSQRGYDRAQMNTNDWVWNAFVSRPLLKGAMTAKVELYDILHQLSARSYSVNAQSRVETYYNSIPHYAMLCIGYRLAKKPKR